MKLKNYFAFENALESIKYYEENFGATLVQQTPVPEELKEQLNVESVEGSTYSATLTIFENDFQISDCFGIEKGFTENFNVLIEFSKDEGEKFTKSIEMLKNVDCIFSNIEDENSPYKMYRVRDVYGIIWSLILI